MLDGYDVRTEWVANKERAEMLHLKKQVQKQNNRESDLRSVNKELRFDLATLGEENEKLRKELKVTGKRLDITEEAWHRDLLIAGRMRGELQSKNDALQQVIMALSSPTIGVDICDLRR
jgi:hypothetical protein